MHISSIKQKYENQLVWYLLELYEECLYVWSWNCRTVCTNRLLWLSHCTALSSNNAWISLKITSTQSVILTEYRIFKLNKQFIKYHCQKWWYRTDVVKVTKVQNVLSCKQKRILSQFGIFLKLSMSTRHLIVWWSCLWRAWWNILYSSPTRPLNSFWPVNICNMKKQSLSILCNQGCKIYKVCTLR